MKMLILKIDGAVVAPEMKKVDLETWKSPQPNTEYQWFAVIDGWPMASKNKKDWCIAYGIVLNGEKKNAVDVAASLEAFTRRIKQEEEQ